MDYREESFRRKFGSAAQLLNVGPDQIVSLKFREDVGSTTTIGIFSIRCSTKPEFIIKKSMVIYKVADTRGPEEDEASRGGA